MRPFESPQAGDAERGAEFADEGQDVVGVAGAVVVDPQEGGLLGRGGRNEVESGRVFFDLQFVGELAVKLEGACGVVGRHDVEGAGKVSEVISHDFAPC